MKNRILIALNEKGLYVAMYEGPHRAKIERLFGCNMAPTAFTKTAPIEFVVDALQHLNPDVEVRAYP